MKHECMYQPSNIMPYMAQPGYMLAKAYVPYQIYFMKLPLDEALKEGTIFPELIRPYDKKGCK
ncbi:MAG: spore coat associated protein CotJA [Bacillota bacterium]